MTLIRIRMTLIKTMLRIYNTLTRKIEEFRPLDSSLVNIYSCGPTVYDYQHIGHMRRYVGDDILVRALKSNNYKVKHVMNITDVGHLTSDSDTGEDKMEKGARKFKMTVWDIAKKFEKQFFQDSSLLNIERPDFVMHATAYIKEQIVFIKHLLEKGFTYKIDDGIYFDTSKFRNYNKLRGEQSSDELKSGVRVEIVEGKKNPTDFALWKLSPSASSGLHKRLMQWESPWGVGFPGWHIECSTMAIKGLGTETLDIDTGGVDHISIHHTNEVAQSEAATGKQFVRYWVHHNFLLVNNQKMSKSLENSYLVSDIVKKGFDPLALRYLYLQTHYRQEMNFTWPSMEGAQTAYHRLINEVAAWDKPAIGCAEFEQRFLDAVNDDMNMSKALSVMWEMVKSQDFPTSAKAESIFRMDEILGLGLKDADKRKKQVKIAVPLEVKKLIEEREHLRKERSFMKADHIRNKIKKMGYNIRDTEKGMEVEKIE